MQLKKEVKFSMSNIFPYLVRGLAVGGQYALIAIGYTMVYGILCLINFAHGDLFMVAGITLIYLTATFPAMPVWVSIPVMIALVVFIGFLIEKCAYSPLRKAPRMSVMISAIGVSYLLQNLVSYITGGLDKQYPEIPVISDRVKFLGISDKLVTFITPFVAVALMFVLIYLINHTKFGMSIRAVSKDFETSQLMGIKLNKVISITFAIGAFLAAIGSILYFTKSPGIKPTTGALPGLKAFIAAVVGGIGSVPGAVVGAFIIGIVENLAKFANLSTYTDAFTFALLIIVLIFKPTGIFGEKVTEKV